MTLIYKLRPTAVALFRSIFLQVLHKRKLVTNLKLATIKTVHCMVEGKDAV